MNVNQETLGAIDRCFVEFFSARKNPGLQFAISYRGEIVHAGSLGSRSLHPNLPMIRGTISRIASMTKSFATAAILRLRDAGLVELDARVSQIISSLALAEPFASCSLRDLMAMRLDLPDDDPWADRLLGATNEEIEPFFAMPLIRAGLGATECAYSNLSYLLLGRIIAHVSARPAMEYITEEIVRPLNLRNTIWNPSDEHKDHIATGYRVDCDPPQAESYFTCRSDGAVFGGLWSNVSDLATWLEFLRAAPGSPIAWDSVLPRASRRELWGCYSNYPAKTMSSLITGQPLNGKADYGFGLVRSIIGGVEYLSHSGGIPGYGSHMRVHTATGFGVIALGNGTYCEAALPCTSALHYLVTTLDEDLRRIPEVVHEIGMRVADFILSGASSHDDQLFSYNFWIDNLAGDFTRQVNNTLCELGALGEDVRVGAILSTSGYRGEIEFLGQRGTKKLEFRLAPHLPARVQALAWL